MNIAVLIIQISLASLFALVGGSKAFAPNKIRENPKMTWAHGKGDGYIRSIGLSEILGAVGLVLPLAVSAIPWLTPLAAVGLAAIQLLAIFTVHLPRKEYQVLPLNVVLLMLSVFVAYGRWSAVQ
ncbi:MAG: DoxX family protein [Armatimonadetes bacterium]|nr:DoxX family protein [Armatimonadota bacterium]